MHVYHDLDVIFGIAGLVFTAVYAGLVVRRRRGLRRVAGYCFLAWLALMSLAILSLGLTPPRLHWVYESLRVTAFGGLVGYLAVSFRADKLEADKKEK